MDLLIWKIFPEFCFMEILKGKGRDFVASVWIKPESQLLKGRRGALKFGKRVLGLVPYEKPPSWASSACWLRYATNCVRELTCSFLWIFFRWVLTV